MHCLITPPAGLPPPAWLDALLADARETAEPPHDPLDPHSPGERLLGRLAGLPADAPLPLAAWRVGEPGAWAFLSPVHLQIQTHQVVALPQSALDLDAVASTALFEALADLFSEADGWQRRWLDTGTWAVSHPDLDGLQLASLSRAVNRPLTPWLPDDRRIRRWTNEVQMRWHHHAVTAGRHLPPNSVWWWGAGVASCPAPNLRVLDDFPPGAPEDLHTLSLAGDDRVRSFRVGARRWWQRRGPGATDVLASL